MNKNDFIWGFLTLLVTSGVLFIVSKFKEISLIWILSPFWEVLLMILLATTMAFLRTIILCFIDFVKYYFKRKSKKVVRKEE